MNCSKIFSLCNPCSEHHAVKDFKALKDTNIKILIGTLTTVVTLLTLPTFGLLGVLTFRTLVNKFTATELDKKKDDSKIKEESDKVKKHTQGKLIPKEQPENDLKEEKIQQNRKNLFSLAGNDHLQKQIKATPLIKAVINNDKEEVIKLLEQGANINEADINGCLPFHWAAREGNLDILTIIFKHLKKTDIDKTDLKGFTALHFAAYGGHLEVVKYLISNNASSSINKGGDAPSDLAIANQYFEVAQVLAEQYLIFLGENDEHQSIINKILCTCIKLGKIEEVEHLLEADVDLEFIDTVGLCPIHYAVGFGKLDIVQLLISKSPHVINLRDKKGHTALYHAIMHHYPDIAKFLIEKGANPNIDKDETPIHLAVRKGQCEIVKLLIPIIPDINVQNGWGHTPLFIACRDQRLSIIELLLKNNADKNIRNNLGESPLDEALGLNNKAIIDLLKVDP